MPLVGPNGGRTYNPEAVIVTVPVVNMSAASNQAALTEQPRTVQQASAENTSQVLELPHQIVSVADLPQNARVGQTFTSRFNPTVIYVFCADETWRGWTLTSVA